MNQKQAKKLIVQLARRNGLESITKESFCMDAGIPVGSLSHHTGLHFEELLTYAYAEVGLSGGRTTRSARRRMLPNMRRDQLLETALCLSRSIGYLNLTRERIAEAADTSPALVSHYFDGMHGLISAMMVQAVAREDLTVIQQGIAMRHPVAMKAPQSLRRRAMAHEHR